MVSSNLKAFSKNISGGVATAVGIIFPVVVVAAGGAVDYANATKHQASLQRALDATVVSLATSDAVDTEKTAMGEALLASSYDGNCNSLPEFDFNGANTSGSVSCQVPNSVLQIIGMTDFTITAESEAFREEWTTYPNRLPDSCVLTLSETSQRSLDLTASGDLDADCSIRVNSDATNAINVVMSGHLTAPSLDVHGGFSNTSSGNVNTVFNDNMPRIPDPLAGLGNPAEASGGCDYTNETLVASSLLTVPSGVYCGGLDVIASGNVTLEPGVYVFRNGDFKLTTSGQVTGDGVLLYFEGDARFDVASSADIRLDGLDSGDFAGVVIAQSNENYELSVDFNIAMSGNSYIEGTVYLPRSDLHLATSGNSNLDASYTWFIANNVQWASSGDITIRSDSTTDTPLPQAIQDASAPIVSESVRIVR